MKLEDKFIGWRRVGEIDVELRLDCEGDTLLECLESATVTAVADCNVGDDVPLDQVDDERTMEKAQLTIAKEWIYSTYQGYITDAALKLEIVKAQLGKMGEQKVFIQ